MTRICLINPRLEGPYPPLGLAYLASYLDKYAQTEHEIKILDGNCSKDVIGEVLDFEPSVVGFTALSPQIHEAVRLSSLIRSKRKDTFQVIGGIHVCADTEHTLKKGSFDLAVIGEGEQTFQEVVDTFSHKGPDKHYYANVDGIAYLDHGGLVMNSPRKEIEDLDSIPPARRDLLPMEFYLSHYLVIRGLSGKRIATIHTSRGCPYDCIFCSCGIVFKKVRYFSADYVISEIQDLIGRYSVQALFFTDDTFILDKKRVEELSLQLITHGIHKKIKWEIQGRANLIDWQDVHLLKLMKEAGCVQIDYGFESGSEKILKMLKKKDVSIGQNKRAIEVTKAAGLRVMGTFMMGVPGETTADIELTKKFIMENGAKIDSFQVFIATPYPGAELYDICRLRNIVEDDYFKQVQKVRDGVVPDFYSDTVSHEEVLQAQRFLYKLAVKKLKIFDMFSWLWFNLSKNPFKTLKRIYRALVT